MTRADAEANDPSKAAGHAERCRTLAARARTATLATLALEPAGFPFASLVAVAFVVEGSALLLLSGLAEHTKNLAARAEASLLVTTTAKPCAPFRGGPPSDPLASPRATLVGELVAAPIAEQADLRARFVATHPEASTYATFSDFAMFVLRPRAIRFVGGFGRMSWVDVDDYRRAAPDALATLESGIIQHMNDDHADAVALYARELARIEGTTRAALTGVDQRGFDLVAEVRREPGSPVALCTARLEFDDAPVTTSDAARRAFIALLARARAAAAERAVSAVPEPPQPPQLIESSSTSNTSVESGGITGGKPRDP